MSRLNDKEHDPIVVVMQRLHEDDLAGHLLGQGTWEHLDMPAIAVEDAVIPLGQGRVMKRQCGNVLHEKRESKDTLNRIKDEIGSLKFSAQYTSEQFQRLMADHGVVCSMSRSGNVWDNAAMESFFSSLKTERTARKIDRSRDEAKAEVFDYIERFYNPKRRHSTIGYMSPMEFERKAGLA